MKDAQMAAVQVAVRIRPLTERDRMQPRFNNDVLRAKENHVQIVSQNKYFTYDHVFGPETQQSDVFYKLGEKPVQKFIEGYNITMLAYGQTSSGKTHTMGTAQHTTSTNPEDDGMVPRAMALLFDMLQNQHQQLNDAGGGRMIRPTSQSQSLKYKYSVKVSFVEIYNEELIDLLNSAPPSERTPVNIREDTKGHIYWTGVKEVTVNSTSDVLYYLQQGTANRATGSTDMNEKSSRSHAIFSVTLKQEKCVSSSQSSRAASPLPPKGNQSKYQSRLSPASKPPSAPQSDDGDWVITSSKFHFVDLAGSERLKRTAAEGDRRKEGININAGLLALGNVISALGDPSKKSTHIPYRDSKLTRLLQDSLGGSAITLMIACCSPAESNLSETLNTLQYANRARNIKNKIEKNELEEWMTTDNLDLLRNMISKLKTETRLLKSAKATDPGRPSPDFGSDTLSSPNSTDFDDSNYDQKVLIADLRQQIEELQNSESVARQRNIVVEKELAKLRDQSSYPNDFDFQHFAEPVIEEYEKSISALEYQLALVRAAVLHANEELTERQAKIEQFESLVENQEKIIAELKRRNLKHTERRMKDEKYVSELEKKLMAAVEEAVHDREMLSELRGKILKLKEVDENTEQYIHDLESRLTKSEMERTELKEKLNSLIASNREEGIENKAEMNFSEQEQQKRMKELHDKYMVSEKERQRLETQIEQLLVAGNSKTENDQKVMNDTLDQANFEKNSRIRELELSLANLNHEHQETLKELEDTINKYQGIKEPRQGSTANSPDGRNDEEIRLLRQSVQHLEHELDLASKREQIFRQMSEEHSASMEVEKTLQKLEGKDNSDQYFSSEYALHTFETMQKKLEQLEVEFKLKNLSIRGESDAFYNLTAEDQTNSTADIRTKFETQLLQYKRELKNLTRILKEVKKTKAAETRFASSNNNSLANNCEHRMLIIGVVTIDKQLTEQYEKMKIEAKRFSNDFVELLSNNSDGEQRVIKSHNSETTSESDVVLSPTETSVPNSPTNSVFMQKQINGFGSHSGKSSVISNQGLAQASENGKSRYAAETRLSIAREDIKMHKVIIRMLEHKFKMIEISLVTFKKQIDNEPVSDADIKELLSRMETMNIQFENNKENV